MRKKESISASADRVEPKRGRYASNFWAKISQKNTRDSGACETCKVGADPVVGVKTAQMQPDAHTEFDAARGAVPTEIKRGTVVDDVAVSEADASNAQSALAEGSESFLFDEADASQKRAEEDGSESACETAFLSAAAIEYNQNGLGKYDRTGKNYRTKRGTATSKICKIAILTALSTVLLLLEFPIFPATPFYQLNFSDVPVLIGTFMFGPWVGGLISTLKVLLFYLFRGSSSAFIGEISNIVGGLAFAVPAGLIYGKKHGIKRALIALIAGAVCFTVVMALFNLFALLPWYARQFMPEMVNFRPRLILVVSWCVPFNLIKAVATSILTFVLYKATRKVFKLF